MNLPKQFQNIDISDFAFSTALNELINGTGNLFINGAAGVGKSLLIKIVASSMKNCVVLSTTGITALNLCTDDVKAATIHSFFLLPPVDIIPDDTTISSNFVKNITSAKCILIDEASMMSSQLFDAIVKKVSRFRKKGTLPRFLLFGDVMQLPPVISNEPHVNDFYNKEYDGKMMFFNSHWFSNLDFKIITLRKVYRQQDAEFKQRLIEVGFNEHNQDTYDYFNKRVMSLQEFERAHPQYIRLASTNSIVNKINAEYVANFPGKATMYKASISDWKGQTPNDENVILKPGIQVMCNSNNYDEENGSVYRNGSLGTVIDCFSDSATIKLADGTMTRVVRSTSQQFVAQVDSKGDVEYIPRGSFNQIDCKPCKACTIHRAQGKTIDAVYFQLNNWTPEGLLYVALSRTPEITGLGLSRKITKDDIKVNQEAWEFLQMGDEESTAILNPEPNWDAIVGT
jgi:ATP-dependent exoDNAse (exonuclease V) alpha subunit